MTHTAPTEEPPRGFNGATEPEANGPRGGSARTDGAGDFNDSLTGLPCRDLTIFALMFERDPTPRFILDSESRIHEANRAGRALVASGVVGAGGMLLCTSHRHRPNLIHAVKRVSQNWQSTGRVLVRGQDDVWCLIELLGAEEWDGLVIAAMRRTTELTAERLEPLRVVFGLTPVETQVLTHIAGGEAPKEVARALSMSIFTVRAHLRTIFVKLDVHGVNGMLRLTLQLAL